MYFSVRFWCVFAHPGAGGFCTPGGVPGPPGGGVRGVRFWGVSAHPGRGGPGPPRGGSGFRGSGGSGMGSGDPGMDLGKVMYVEANTSYIS